MGGGNEDVELCNERLVGNSCGFLTLNFCN